uniref:Uncharacterized protein n=1 Tax=Eptatretus burgeri TaxID=7764 RepID=A0A8C4QZ71_EPTBU
MELLQNEGRGARLFARRRERTSRLEALIERQSPPVAGKSATEGRAVPPLLTGCAEMSEKVGVDLQWGAWPTRVTPPVGVAAKLRSTSSKKAPLKSGKVPRRPLSSLNRSARPFTPISSPPVRSPTISLTVPFVQVSSNTMPQPFPPLASPLASPYTMPPPLASPTTAYSFPQSGSADIPPPRSGLLDSARGRHNQHLPMFTFQERPKLAPNPDLLSLVQRIDTGQVESQNEGKEVNVNPRPSSEVVKAKLQAGGRGAELFRRREVRMEFLECSDDI